VVREPVQFLFPLSANAIEFREASLEVSGVARELKCPARQILDRASPSRTHKRRVLAVLREKRNATVRHAELSHKSDLQRAPVRFHKGAAKERSFMRPSDRPVLRPDGAAWRACLLNALSFKRPEKGADGSRVDVHVMMRIRMRRLYATSLYPTNLRAEFRLDLFWRGFP